MNETTLRAGDELERKIAGTLFLAGWYIGGRKAGNNPSRDLEVFVPSIASWERLEVKNESNYATSPHTGTRGRPLARERKGTDTEGTDPQPMAEATERREEKTA